MYMYLYIYEHVYIIVFALFFCVPVGSFNSSQNTQLIPSFDSRWDGQLKYCLSPICEYKKSARISIYHLNLW